MRTQLVFGELNSTRPSFTRRFVSVLSLDVLGTSVRSTALVTSIINIVTIAKITAEIKIPSMLTTLGLHVLELCTSKCQYPV